MAYGFEEYFEDGWNLFDFSLIVMQVILDYLIIGIIDSSVIKTFKANKMIKLIKIQKISRIFKLFRTIKIISIFLYTF